MTVDQCVQKHQHDPNQHELDALGPIEESMRAKTPRNLLDWIDDLELVDITFVTLLFAHATIMDQQRRHVLRGGRVAPADSTWLHQDDVPVPEALGAIQRALDGCSSIFVRAGVDLEPTARRDQLQAARRAASAAFRKSEHMAMTAMAEGQQL